MTLVILNSDQSYLEAISNIGKVYIEGWFER